MTMGSSRFKDDLFQIGLGGDWALVEVYFSTVCHCSL